MAILHVFTPYSRKVERKLRVNGKIAGSGDSGEKKPFLLSETIPGEDFHFGNFFPKWKNNLSTRMKWALEPPILISLQNGQPRIDPQL